MKEDTLLFRCNCFALLRKNNFDGGRHTTFIHYRNKQDQGVTLMIHTIEWIPGSSKQNKTLFYKNRCNEIKQTHKLVSQTFSIFNFLSLFITGLNPDTFSRWSFSFIHRFIVPAAVSMTSALAQLILCPNVSARLISNCRLFSHNMSDVSLMFYQPIMKSSSRFS